MNERIKLLHGDCLELMKEIPDGSVDLILTDLPYNTTDCEWDALIPFEPMWDNFNRVTNQDKVVALFCSEPFSSRLKNSNISNYKYDWIWVKNNSTGFPNANKRPMKRHETISIFYRKYGLYNPQGLVEYNKENTRSSQGEMTNGVKTNTYIQKYTNYPTDILYFPKVSKNVHPTQKPVELLEYLIKTYTNEGDVVLDATMGSGSTGVACVNTNRKFIGIEKEDKYFNIAKERIKEAILNKKEENNEDVFSSMFM